MKTINLPNIIARAEIDQASIDSANRRVRVTWSTGATVRRLASAFGGPYDEELDMNPECVRMQRMQSGMCPVTRGHSDELSDVIGVVESAELLDGIGSASLRFSKRAEVTPVWDDIEDKILRSVSVAAFPFRAKLMGRNESGMPIIRLIDWEPRAIGIVPLGADPGAVIRSAEETTSCELEDSQETPAMRPEEKLDLIRLQIDTERKRIV